MKRLLFAAALSTSLLWGGRTHAQAPDIEPPLTAEELSSIRAAQEARIRAVDSVYGAVVAIYGNDRGGGGSGVLFDEAGLALTNHHVVAAAGTEGWAGLADGKLYRWRIIGTDPGGDVAIIQLLGKERFPVAPLGDSDTVRVGDFAMAMGNPFVLAEDQRPTVTLGIVSGVERFQEGSGNNQLVYGNCIQIDSSINPGNSGGPLFNLQGEVIGINGRGSFKERGRVNVGLGYAISINQAKHFIPDLLATRMVQHGTLDAVFGNRGNEVICHTLNLDSPIAKLGMQLGDKLLAFEGRPIKNANQFTNLISTLPAGWPCEVTFEHEGKASTVHVRLTPLPYGPKQQPMAPPMPPMPMPPMPKPEGAPQTPPPAGEGEKPAEEKKPTDDKQPAEPKAPETPAKPADDKQPPIPMPMQRPMGQRPPNFGEAGEIRDEKLNQENAQRIVARWRLQLISEQGQTAAGWIGTDEIRRGDAVVGKQTITVARDGRFRVEAEVDGKVHRYGHDGAQFWAQPPGEAVAAIDAERLCRNPFAAQGYMLATALGDKPFASFDKVLIDAGDKAHGRLAYRLKATDAQTDEFFVWLSVVGDNGQPALKLLKTGEAYNDDRTPAVTYDDWKPAGMISWPHQRRVVSGLGEAVALAITTQSVQAQSSLEDSLFKQPEK